MHNSYVDIYDLADAAGGQEPQWWDENGVPRFAPFDRRLCPNIYAGWIALLRIRCTVCGQEFLAQLSGDCDFWPPPDAQSLGYGDPPWHYDQYVQPCAGNSMICDDLEVVEFWVNTELGWTRTDQSDEHN